MNDTWLRNDGAARVSHFIKRRPAVNFHHATRYADKIGLPLNRIITINFSALGCPPDLVSKFLQMMISQRFAPWLRRTSAIKVPLTYVWCIEGAGQQMAAHLLVHIPVPIIREFEARLRQWLCGLFDAAELDPAVVHIREVYNLIGARRYLLKGVDPAWANHLGIQPVAQGLVVGKRSGFSRNLGPTARLRGGYRPRRRPFGAGPS
jgi:hypothetical protein